MAPRLRQVAQLLAIGLSEKQVALRLRLSIHTVHDYVKQLHRKLGVSSRGELLALLYSERQPELPEILEDEPEPALEPLPSDPEPPSLMYKWEVELHMDNGAHREIARQIRASIRRVREELTAVSRLVKAL